MFRDARTLQDSAQVFADICILGAGAAGITIAREFDNSGFDVCLLESGGLEIDTDTQLLYQGKNVGLDYWPTEAARLRYFGGSMNHWGRTCLPMHKIGFEDRSWVPDSGWPITWAELEPYYRRAHPIFRLGEYNFDPDYWETSEIGQLPFDKQTVVTKIKQHCQLESFPDHYRNDLDASKNVKVYPYANAVDIETDDDARTVRKIHAATLTGKRFTVQARAYVLALGGIENARLLLLSSRTQPTGLGNQHDLVGRYFADHPYFSNLGFMLLSDEDFNVGLYRKWNERGDTEFAAYLSPSREVQAREKLLLTRIHIQESTWSKYSKGVRALDEMADSISALDVPDDFMRKLYTVITDIDNVASAGRGELADEKVIRVGAWVEPQPRRDSRVYLGDETDALGQRKIVLDWRIGEEEKDSLVRSLRIVANEMGRVGLGRMRLDIDEDSPWPWTGGGTPGLHHMGTTRMSDDQQKGVVDKNCRIHGTDNLYVAGSSVFPTYCVANPTYTIAALALRLSDHLRTRL